MSLGGTRPSTYDSQNRAPTQRNLADLHNDGKMQMRLPICFTSSIIQTKRLLEVRARAVGEIGSPCVLCARVKLTTPVVVKLL